MSFFSLGWFNKGRSEIPTFFLFKYESHNFHGDKKHQEVGVFCRRDPSGRELERDNFRPYFVGEIS